MAWLGGAFTFLNRMLNSPENGKARPKDKLSCKKTVRSSSVAPCKLAGQGPDPCNEYLSTMDKSNHVILQK